MRVIFQNILLLCGGLLVVLVLLEGAMYFLPVNESLGSMPVNQANPIFKYTPNRTVEWSKFPDFSMRNVVHVNNVGFINDQEYVAASPVPLVAVIGDSYVEALMVPYAETMHGHLTARLDGAARVYTFAASGMPLSQYLAYAAHARDTYHPRKCVIVVVGNDFDESLSAYKVLSGAHQFNEVAGHLVLERTDYEPGAMRVLLRKSKLLNYLFANCSILNTWGDLGGETSKYVGNTLAEGGVSRVEKSKRVIDVFMALLPEATGLAAADILLVLDGLRPSLYTSATTGQDSYFGQMRTYLMQKALEQGVPIIDMQTVFRADYEKNGQVFEFPKDGHWNSHAHALAAAAVVQSGFLSSLKK